MTRTVEALVKLASEDIGNNGSVVLHIDQIGRRVVKSVTYEAADHHIFVEGVNAGHFLTFDAARLIGVEVVPTHPLVES